MRSATVCNRLSPTTGPVFDDYETISQSGIDERLDAGDSVSDGDGAQFFVVKGYGTRFVFIIDCSGSMEDYRRWKRAVHELKRSINGLLDAHQFVILLYNFEMTPMNNQPAKLVVASPANQRSAIKWLQKQKPMGATYVATALQQAFELSPDSIFLLSDGDFDDLPMVEMVLQHYNGRAELRGALNGSTLAERHHQPIPVNTISLGGASGTRTMRRIAEQNHGVFKLIED